MLDREMLYEALHKEIPILTTQIRKLYAELDQKFHLEGAKVPMTFGMRLPWLLYTGRRRRTGTFSFFPAVCGIFRGTSIKPGRPDGFI